MKVLTIAYFEIKKLFRDWRLIVIIASQPIVIAALVGLISYQSPTDINVGFIDYTPGHYSKMFQEELSKQKDLNLITYSDVDETLIKEGRLRGFIEVNIDDQDLSNASVNILNDPSGRYVAFIAQPEITRAVEEVSKNIAADNLIATAGIRVSDAELNPVKVNVSDATPFELKFFDYYGSAMMVLLIILVVVNLSAISITNERIQGTFERLFVTPYTKSTIIFGKALALFLIGVIVAFIANLSLYLMFHVAFGNVWLIALIDTLVVATSVTLGLMVSSLTYTVVESVQLAMYLFFVSVLTTGVFAPLESTQKTMQLIIKFVPFYYAVDASRRINMLDAGWSQVSANVYILIGSFLTFLVLSIVFLRREAK